MKVLIAEDDYASRLLLQRTLETLGHECVAAEDGIEAWEAYRKTPGVEVVISDWMMPNMDGIEFCRRVRDAEGDRRPFFIMLTALGGRERLLEGLRAGADEYLVKPLDREQLRARLLVASRAAALYRRLADDRASAAAEDPGTPPAAEAAAGPAREGRGEEGARIWGILASQGKINEEQLQRALEAQREDPREIGEVLVSLGTITEVDLARVRAQSLGLSYVEVDVRDVDPAAVDLLPEGAMRERGVLPLRAEDGRLFLATSEPANVEALDELAALSGRKIVPVVAATEEIRRAQSRLFVSEQRGRMLEEANEAAGEARGGEGT